MTLRFEHGKSYISVDGDIISVQSVGAFNEEGIVETINELKSVINSFKQEHFKLLLDYSLVEGGTPEVFDKINQCNIWLNSQNMVAKAVVVGSVIQLEILEKRAPAREQQNIKNFETKASALIWLNSQT